jgi:hypothetical protein
LSSAIYASAKGELRLYVVFVEKGLQLLNGGGSRVHLPHGFNAVIREVISRANTCTSFTSATSRFLRARLRLLRSCQSGVEACRWVRADDLPAWLQLSARRNGVAAGDHCGGVTH